jgi:sarcosine oxidase subunit beta
LQTKHVDNVVRLVTSPARSLPAAGEVVILGGGIMGTSIAYHLAAAGVQNVVLVERNVLGSGPSAKPLGGVRATFSDPGNIRLGQGSLEAYERFGEKFRTDIGLRQVGYLFLCRNQAELLQVEDSAHIQNRLGGSSRMVSPEEAYQINPFLDPRALVAASYSPRDGFAQPSKVVQAYAKAAQQLGVTICQDMDVLDIDAAGGSVRAIHTNRGSIRTSMVICAAGAWSTRLGAMAGVHLPIEPVRRQIGMRRRALSDVRTPAVSALGVQRLATPGPKSLPVFGTGPQAWQHQGVQRRLRAHPGRNCGTRRCLSFTADRPRLCPGHPCGRRRQ